MDIVCDRFMEEDVFDDSTMDRTDLVLIGGSHLGNVARNISQEHWKVSDLTRPGLRINGSTVTVTDMVERVLELSSNITMDNATVILQIFDNSVYMVGGLGGGEKAPWQGPLRYLSHRRQRDGCGQGGCQGPRPPARPFAESAGKFPKDNSHPAGEILGGTVLQ
jgi:hypothetical protein